MQRAFAHEHGRRRAAGRNAGLDDISLGVAVRIRFEFQQVGLEQNHFQQLVHAGFGHGGTLDENGVAAPIVRHETFFLQLLADAQRVCVRMINFIDRDENRHFRRLRVCERFQSLRHHAVVRGDDEHDDVRDVRAARAHGAERRVTGRVEKSDLRELLFAFRMRHRNRVSADVLRDATGFTRRDIRLANHVEQRRFAVVNVTHDGDDRCARLQIFRLVVDVQLNFFLGCVNNAFALRAFLRFKLVAVMRTNLRRNFFVNRLIDGRHDLQLHQLGDDGERLLLQRICECTHHNRRLDGDDLSVGRQI